MTRRKLILILVLSMALLASPSALAAVPTDRQEKQPAKGGALFISEGDFIKRKIGEVLSWAVGYDISRINQVRLVPTINLVEFSPKVAPPDGRTVVTLMVSASDPGGLRNISGVRADLSSIGQRPNTMLVDNGYWGDKLSGDGIFTLQTNIDPKTPPGPKEISVAVVNKAGWLAYATATIMVERNPIIVWGEANPKTIRANGRDILTLTIKIDNPGRIEDAGIVADLTSIGGEANTVFFDTGTNGDQKANDGIFTLQTVVGPDTLVGAKQIPVIVSNFAGGKSSGEIAIRVVK